MGEMYGAKDTTEYAMVLSRGRFRFSVLDNGVTSDEFWTILGAADDLSWVCFHYAGAAGAVGQVRFELHVLCV